MSPTSTAPTPPILLSIIELGGYPNFTPLYERAGYRVETVISVRKALAALKTLRPAVIVAEFNFQSDFRDRTSSLESLLAAVQRSPGTRVVVFYEPEHDHQLDRLRARFPIFAALPYPIDAGRLEDSLRGAIPSEENASP
jgi:DNA-binding NtrC family response regulator